jgi:hypothetical protein
MPTLAWRRENRDRCREHKRRFYLAHKAQVMAESAVYREETRRLVNALKAERGCKLCLERDVICLDFHHSKGEKDFSISAAIVRGLGRSRILAEAAKCDVVCANCHRKLHAMTIGLAGVV